jgi:16S rRNA (guanine966-N2)-methyltransferase
MRVIAGEWRGRPLIAPPGQSTRPTADRVRESLFSMLASRIGDFEGLAAADLYAGSGALGIEALSRGAASCAFVDCERGAIDALRRNLDALKATERARIINSRVESFASSQQFQLIFADPPYASGSGTHVVEAADRGHWLAPGGWLAIETARGESVDPGTLALEAERDIGRARITLLRNG